MDGQTRKSLEELFTSGKMDEIVNRVQVLEHWKEDPELTGTLARALNNLERYEEALSALDITANQGREDGYWHFRRGYALYYLDRIAEAEEEFRETVRLLPDEVDAWQFLQWCAERMGNIEAAAEAERQVLALQPKTRELTAGDEAVATEFLLTEGMCRMFETTDIRQGDNIFLPVWGIRIRPQVVELKEHSALLYIYVFHPEWDRTIFECSAGYGQDPNTAIGMAATGFLFGLMSSIQAMLQKINPEPLTTEFAGKEHRFYVYRGNLIGMGKIPEESTAELYWNVLKDGIAKRIGNQKLCYVKVYGAKHNGTATGECRINDVPIPALETIIKELVEQWETEEFASVKMFFLLKQEKETYEPVPYTQEEIAGKTVQAALLFQRCVAAGEAENYPEQLKRLIGDPALAAELEMFLPEICAENALKPEDVSEKILLRCGNGNFPVYRVQLAGYSIMRTALLNGLAEGSIPEEAYYGYLSQRSKQPEQAVLSMPPEYKIR